MGYFHNWYYTPLTIPGVIMEQGNLFELKYEIGDNPYDNLDDVLTSFLNLNCAEFINKYNHYINLDSINRLYQPSHRMLYDDLYKRIDEIYDNSTEPNVKYINPYTKRDAISLFLNFERIESNLLLSKHLALDYECLQYSTRTLMSRLLLLINNYNAYGRDPLFAFSVFDRYLNESFNMKIKFPEKDPIPINNTHIPDNMYKLLVKSILYAYNKKITYSYDYVEKNGILVPVFKQLPSIIKSVPSPKYIVVDAISSYNDLRRKLAHIPLKNYMSLADEEKRIRKSIYYMTPDGYVIFYCKPAKFWAIGMFATMMPMVQIVSIASHTHQRLINKS